MQLKNRDLFWVKAEDIVGEGKNADYQHFLLFPQCFRKVSFPGPLKGLNAFETGTESS